MRTCVEDPAELAAACLRFHQHPLTIGFQSGALSPILNALRPDDFAIMHSKSLRVVNFFGHRRVSADLTDYPAANAAALQLVQRIADVGGVPPELELAPVDRFDLFCDWLVTVEQYNFRHTHYWLIRLDESAPGGNQWDAWRSGGFMALGYDELGDLSDIGRAEFNAMRDQLAAQTPGATKRSIDALWPFAARVQPGDAVAVVNFTGEVLGTGVITGFYYFVPDAERGHCRPVEWTDLQRRRPGDALDKPRDFQSIDAARFHALASAPLVMDKRDPAAQPSVAESADMGEDGEIGVTHEPARGVLRETPSPYAAAGSRSGPPPKRTLAQIAAESGFSESQLATWVDAVERKGQAIFYGPPGTGKSYVAAQLALHLAGGDDGFVESVQFHPAYAYEDFVQGIRPVADADGRLTYRLTPGLFVRFCAEAARRRGRCVLVIDEINRADLARVFGEVMQLIEYREQSLALAAGGHLRIPANVRILGTMNTADRSIALVDAALRRRFAFLALYPDFDILRHFHNAHETGFPVERLVTVLRRLNRDIGDVDYALGVTFFLRADLVQTMPAVWQTEVEPYLEAFFFDRSEMIAPFRWSALADEILGERQGRAT
ncbi:MAG: AAA family ATPase [Caldilineaceae bacterium]